MPTGRVSIEFRLEKDTKNQERGGSQKGIMGGERRGSRELDEVGGRERLISQQSPSKKLPVSLKRSQRTPEFGSKRFSVFKNVKKN